jgi:hypothetical protein
MSHRARFGAVLLVACGLTACAATEQDAAPARSEAETAAAAERARWPYWPREMRVHPLTRIVYDAHTGETLLEARVELFDQHHHTTKGDGFLTLVLRDAADRPDVPARATWTCDLTDPGTNLLHFDDVTRTYLLRLELHPEQLPDHPVLVARFASADELVFEDSLAVRRK